jgi:hypothetical protein
MRVITMIVATFVATVPSVVAQQRLTPRQKADRAAWQHRQMADPATGQVPIERLQDAYEKLERQAAALNHLETRSMANCDNPNWIEIGPDNVTSGGRVRSLCVLPSGKAFTGSVTGGLWTCDNIRATTPFWRKVNDFFQNLCVSSIAVHPTNSNILYFGTGEGWLNDIYSTNPQQISYYNRGNGIWKSTDGGVTWNVLPNTQNTNFRFTQKIIVTTTGVIYAGTYQGVLRSNDGGNSWITVMNSGSLGLTVNEVSDMEMGSDGTIYAAFGIQRHGGIFKMNTSGTWSRIGGGSLSNGLPTGNDTEFIRTELACAPNNANVMYAAIEFNPNNQIRIYRSTNAGANWAQVATGFATNQGWYSMALGVAPTNENMLYFGNSQFLRRTTIPVTGTPTWTILADHNTASSYVHADYHQIIFDAISTDNAYICTDGGVFSGIGMSSAVPSFISKNQNLRIVQFQTCAMSSEANNFEFLGGSQDNSMHQFNSAGCLTNSVKFADQIGDGGYGFINPYNPDQRVASAFYNYYLVSNNRGLSFQPTGIFESLKDVTGQFINPTDWSIPDATASSPVNMFSSSNTSTSGRLYRWNNIFSAIPTQTILNNPLLTSAPTAIKVSPNNPNTLYLGICDAGAAAKIIKVTNANSATPTFTNITGSLSQIGYISCIEVKKQATGDQELVVTFSNYGITSVYYTQTGTNSSPNWIPIDGINLPDIPIRWALFAPDDATANSYNYRILLATEAGVWATTSINTSNGPTTTWQSINNGDLPNVPVYMLRYRESDKLVLAATHGRGMWRSDMFSPIKVNFRAKTTNIAANCPQTFISCTSGSASVFAWDFQKDGVTDATIPEPTTSVYGSQIKLTVNGNICVAKDRADVFNVDFSLPLCWEGGGPSVPDLPSFLMRVTLSPNPTHNSFHIETLQDIRQVDLYDITGKLIEKYEATKEINMQKHSAGVYLCKITFVNGQIAVQKIIKE